MKSFLYLCLGLIIITGSLWLFFKPTNIGENRAQTIKINEISIEVEVVNTPEKLSQGLSGREHLPENTGMFFIFEQPGQYGFWMKEMLFAIDIIWIDENFQVVGVERMVKPETFPKTFYPPQPIKYVLELPSGTADQYNIVIGTVIQ